MKKRSFFNEAVGVFHRVNAFLIAFYLISSSCTKEDIVIKDKNEKSVLSQYINETKDSTTSLPEETLYNDYPMKDSTKYCLCNCCHLITDTGGFKCPTPWDGCAVTRVCPCDVVTAINTPATQHALVIKDFIAFREAVELGKVKDFFNTERWRPLFPNLNLHPEWVKGFKDGNYTIVKKENSANSVFFIAAPSNIHPDIITPSDALFAIEVPAGMNL